MPIKWSEKKIAAFLAEGRGSGEGVNYKPWIRVGEISSKGRKRPVQSARFGRDVHLLSDIEFRFFLMLERSLDVLEVREQYPLERDLTLEVARQLGIRHSYHRGTHVPIVMTVDFMVALNRNGMVTWEVFDTKSDEDVEDERTLEKLEIQRTACELMELPHHVVLGSQLDRQEARNLEWVHDALVKPGEHEPRPGFFDDMANRLSTHIGHVKDNRSLSDTCADFDRIHNVEDGTGLRCAQILMYRRELGLDLQAVHPALSTIGALRLASQSSQLQVVGGR